jgi:hypothetical protein
MAETFFQHATPIMFVINPSRVSPILGAGYALPDFCRLDDPSGHYASEETILVAVESRTRGIKSRCHRARRLSIEGAGFQVQMNWRHDTIAPVPTGALRRRFL